jgi:pre-mRNA-processing factor 6
VRACINMGVEEEDRYRTWKEDAKTCLEKGSVETARALYAYALQVNNSPHIVDGR